MVILGWTTALKYFVFWGGLTYTVVTVKCCFLKREMWQNAHHIQPLWNSFLPFLLQTSLLQDFFVPYYRASFNVGATGLFPFELFPLIVLRTAMTTLTAEKKICPLREQSHSQGRSWVTCAGVLISIISLIVSSAFQEGNKWVNSPFVMFHHSRSQFAEHIPTWLDCQSFSSVSESDRMQSSPRQWARLQSDERPNSRTANKRQQSTSSKLNLHLRYYCTVIFFTNYRS